LWKKCGYLEDYEEDYCADIVSNEIAVEEAPVCKADTSILADADTDAELYANDDEASTFDHNIIIVSDEENQLSDGSSPDELSDESEISPGKNKTTRLSAKKRKEFREAAIEKRRSYKAFKDECRQMTLLKEWEAQNNHNKAGIWAANIKNRAADKVKAFESKMAEVFKSAAAKIASDELMAAAMAAGRIMYASGIPVHPGVIEIDISSPAQLHPPVDDTLLNANSLSKTNIVSPTVSPSVKKPLFTMDMFTPYVDKDLVAWKQEYNVSDAEFSDPDTFCTDTCGNAMKIPYVYKLMDDYKKSVADSKLSMDDVSLDARSERAARRHEVIKKIKENEIAEFEASLRENREKRFNRPRRLSHNVIY
jgi:hypothetical protein